MSELVAPPYPGSYHASLFEEAMSKGKLDLARLYSVGAQIERVRIIADDHLLTSPDEVVGIYEERYKSSLDTYIAEQLDALAVSRTDKEAVYRRAELLGGLTDQLVLLPRLFKMKPSETKLIRQELTASQGVYGLISEVMEHTQEHLRTTPAKDNLTKDHIIGLLNELTATALLNKPQEEDFVALPTLPAEDEKRKTDIKVYWQTRTELRTRDIQVKSWIKDAGAPGGHSNMKKLLWVSGCALGNSTRYPVWRKNNKFMQTSKAIIRDINAEISDEDAAMLATISDGLIAAVKAQKQFVRRPGLYEAAMRAS